MKKCDFFQSIQALFSEKKVKTLTVSEIAKALNLRGGARKKLDRVLRDLLVAGSIVKVGGNRYSLGKLVDLHTGTITILRSGNAFLDSPDGGESIFVSKSDLGTALPGDRVVVRLLPKVAKSPSFRPHGRSRRSRRVETTQTKDKGPSGKVVEILERVHREIVGTLKTTGKFLYVVPIHQAYKHDFYVPDDKGADINDRVLIRFSDWENKHVSPEAEIIDVLGPADNPSLDTLSIIRHYGFSPDFPADVQAEAESVSSYMKRPGQRKDMRDALIITIDPARSRDFDDALSLEVDSDGNRVLGVHIADVSHFVRHNSKLDAEAKRRGNSVYLPDMVVPMLPEQLSNGMCSLRPDEDRLAFSA
ncbi:MAG: RNB domain-containing ribonuclease, partial [Kiritimatiellae bacterium]|nr:RNB domain-containing ribonuclease [Kiritimatiellia bacterium]